MQRHRHQAFIRFLNTIETQMPGTRSDSRVDNYASQASKDTKIAIGQKINLAHSASAPPASVMRTRVWAVAGMLSSTTKRTAKKHLELKVK
jgi:hypothetical protein